MVDLALPALLFASAFSPSGGMVTGWLPEAAPGQYWIAGSRFRAEASARGLEVRRGAKSNMVQFPHMRLRWRPEGDQPTVVTRAGAASWVSHAGLRAANAAPGVDVVLRSGPSSIKVEFEAAAGAIVSDIRYCFAGALPRAGPGGTELWIDESWREEGLRAWQTDEDGNRRPVSARYIVKGSCVSFALGPIDPGLRTTIDPDYVFSTYLGGGLFDSVTSSATDSQGNTFLAGWTESSDFPVLSGYQSAAGGRIDGFIAKLSPTGQLLFATFLGGSGEDRIQSIALDYAGSIIVAGFTASTNFPVHLPVMGALSGGRDAFVTKLNASGTQLQFSTYFGGTSHDMAWAVAVDPNGFFVIGGETSSSIPLTAPLSGCLGGGDAFLVRFSSAGSLQNSTCLGGTGDDRIRALAFGPDWTLHVTGSTASSDFPVVAPSWPSRNGAMDAFYMRLANSMAAIQFSTYLGGSAGSLLAEESGNGISVDASNRVYVAGVTPSSNFPNTAGSYQPSYGGGQSDGFIAVFNGNSNIWSTYLGGTGIDGLTSVAAASNLTAVAGYTTSQDLAVKAPAQATRAGEYDAMWAVFPPGISTPLHVSYLGGTASDSALAVTSGGSAIVAAGSTLSANFPNVAAYQSANAGGFGGFATRVRLGPVPVSISPSSGAGSAPTFALLYSDTDGATDIHAAQFLIASSPQITNACAISYSRPSNQISLYIDSSSSWSSATIGANVTLQNDNCILNAASASAATSGQQLGLNLGITFKAAFAGAKKLFGSAADLSLSSGWLEIGSWNTANALPPAVASLTPASGAGQSQTFTATFSDVNGAADISSAQVLFNTSTGTSNACYLSYSRSANTVSLWNDSTNAWLALSPGANANADNGRCVLSGATLSAVSSGNSLALTLPLAFSSAFSGAKNVYALATDTTSLTTGWIGTGAWTVITPASPAVSAWAPNNGSGSSVAVSFTVSDPNGAGDIATAAALFNNSLATANGCYLRYDRAANTISLFRDSDSTWLPVTPGANATVENPQCSVSGSTASAAASGNQITIALTIGFKPAFTGARTAWTSVTDAIGLTTGWVLSGAWTVVGSSAPAVQSVTPASGSSSSQTFTVVTSDADGAADIQTILFLVNSAITASNGCYISVSPSQGVARLFRDSDQTWLSISPGAGTTVENTNCSLSGTALSISVSGTTATIALPVTFKAPFQGQKQLYASVSDAVNQTSGWIQAGSWNLTTPIPYGIITAPAAGTTFSAASVLFSWSAGNSALDYWLDVGTSPGQGTVFGGVVSGTSKQVTNIPCNGQSVFVRLWTRTASGYLSPLDYIYTAASSCQNGQRGVVSTPQPGSTLTSATPTFSWDAGTGALDYWLDVGTAVGQGNIFGGVVAATSRQVTGVPCNGQTVHVRLWTRNSSGYLSPNDYTFTAASSCAVDPRAAVASPTPNTTLSNNVVTFVWSAGTGALDYWLDVGTAVGQGNISGGVVAGTSKQISGLPCAGQPVHVRLWTRTSGGYLTPIDYTYTAATSCSADPRATLATPSPGTTLSGRTVTFTWSTGTGALGYWLDVGTAAGQGNISAGTVATTSKQVTNLPCNSAPVHVRLWTRTSAGYQTPLDYSFTAAAPGCP